MFPSSIGIFQISYIDSRSKKKYVQNFSQISLIEGLIIRCATLEMIISNYVSYNTMLVEDMIKPLIEDAEHFFKKRCKKRIFINIIN